MAILLPFLASRRFTTTLASGTGTGTTFAVAATTFTNDAGAAATAFPTTFAYYNLYINGVLQMGDTSTATTSSLAIPNGDALDPATPIVVEFIVN